MSDSFVAATAITLCYASIYSHKRNSLIQKDDCPPFVTVDEQTGEVDLETMVIFFIQHNVQQLKLFDLE